jgi:hypothetical protein
LEGKKTLEPDQQWSLKEKVEVKTQVIEELKDGNLGENEQIITKVGSTLTPI